MMKIVSINIGRPREIFHEGRMIRTGIFKTPIPGRVRVNALNIEGDEQADPSVHGGASKAIYAYPVEHYEFWRRELPGVEFPCGSFGKNITLPDSNRHRPFGPRDFKSANDSRQPASTDINSHNHSVFTLAVLRFGVGWCQLEQLQRKLQLQISYIPVLSTLSFSAYSISLIRFRSISTAGLHAGNFSDG